MTRTVSEERWTAVDNVVRDGVFVDRVSATEIQTLGQKGYDGFAAIVVTADR